jgi:uncharacterized membrane protein
MALVTKVFPPKSINSIYGYRTGITMKNQDNWDYGQQIAPGTMIQVFTYGFMVALVTCFFLNYLKLYTLIGPLMLIILIMTSIGLIIKLENQMSAFEKSKKSNK